MLKSKLEQLCTQVLKQTVQQENIEIYAARSSCPDLFDVLSAFANSPGGGTILFGIETGDSDQKPRICGVYDVTDLREKIGWQCVEMEPIMQPLYTEACVEGKYVLAAEVPEIDKQQKPSFHRAVGRPRSAFKRVNGCNQLMTEAEIHNYEACKNRFRDELRTCEQAQWLDINQELVDDYLQRLFLTSRLRGDMDENQLLRIEGLRVDGKPTLAAMLLFGYDPQAFYPQFSVMAAVYSDGKLQTSRRINGTLRAICEQSLQFVRRNIVGYASVEKDGSEQGVVVSYPMDAVREAIINALIHRDYSKYAEDRSAYLWIYEDRIQVCSPGGFFGEPDLQYPRPGHRSLRNPKIMEILETMGELPQENCGLQFMLNSARQAGWEEPEIRVEDDWFSVTFKCSVREGEKDMRILPAEMSELERQVWIYCGEPRTLNDLAAEFGWKSPYYMRDKLLAEMIDKELLGIVECAKQKVRYLAVAQ